MLVSFHSARRSLEEKYFGCLIKHGAMHATVPTYRSTFIHWCNRITTILVANCFLVGFEGCSKEEICAWYYKPAGEIIGPRGEPTLVCYKVMLPNCLLNIYIHTHRFVLFSTLAREAIFVFAMTTIDKVTQNFLRY